MRMVSRYNRGFHPSSSLSIEGRRDDPTIIVPSFTIGGPIYRYHKILSCCGMVDHKDMMLVQEIDDRRNPGHDELAGSDVYQNR
jgi:hypothetical protein